MLEGAGITLHHNLQCLFLSRTTGAQILSAACPEQSRCKALEAEQPWEGNRYSQDITGFSTLKQHILGSGFSRSVVRYRISVWHQLEENRWLLLLKSS